jgi:membrane-associated phospholipid phosphatase
VVRLRARLIGAAALTTALIVAAPAVAATAATHYPSDTTPPNLVTLLGGFNSYWVADPGNHLTGSVANADVLQLNNELAVWINNNASKSEKFRALQDNEYNNSKKTAYDQSFTVSTGLGSTLSKWYVKGRETGKLPLVSALINSSNGTSGDYVSTTAAKNAYSHPRPYLPTDPTTKAVAHDSKSCKPSTVNAASESAIRIGQPYADAAGNLLIKRVAKATDKTHQFSKHSVTLDPGYGTSGLCLGGSFPSGHTTTAYEAGITLATLVPELAPEILARASENGNDRIVLGVHYPLDIVGGRIDGEAALAARWSDSLYRTKVLLPARTQLLNYLAKETHHNLAYDIAHETAYKSTPYNAGLAMPGGTAQIVSDRASALAVYTERLTYGFPTSGDAGLAASVPAGADNLLLTTFPTLTDDQRTSVLAQTEIASGYPLDQTGTADGSWERLNLAAAMSATVQLADDGSITVTSTGGAAQVLPAP